MFETASERQTKGSVNGGIDFVTHSQSLPSLVSASSSFSRISPTPAA